MKKLLLLIILFGINNFLFPSKDFKSELVRQWFVNVGNKRIEINYKDDNTFIYLEKIKKNGQFHNDVNLSGKYKLEGRNINMSFSDKRMLRFQIFQKFYGANNVEYIILDTIGRIYSSERPTIEISNRETARNARIN